MGNDIPGDQNSKYIMVNLIDSIIGACNTISYGTDNSISTLIRLTQSPIHKTYYNLNEDSEKDDPFKEDDAIEQLSDYLEGNF